MVDVSGTLRIEVQKSDLFHVLYFPQGQPVHVQTSASVVKNDWKPVSWTLAERGGDLLLTTATNVVRINKQTGQLRFEDKQGHTLLD